MRKALVKDAVHVLVRKHKNGTVERTTYVGALRNKPAGWTVDKSIAVRPAMACQAGLA